MIKRTIISVRVFMEVESTKKSKETNQPVKMNGKKC